MITDAFRKLCFKESSKLSKDEIKHLRNYITTILVPYITKIKKENPDIDENGVIELLTKKVTETNGKRELHMEEICSSFFVYFNINHLLLHPELYKKINDSIAPGEKLSIDTAMQKAHFDQYDFDYNLKFTIMLIRENLSMHQQKIEETIYDLHLSEEYKDLLDNENLSKEARLRKANDYIKKELPWSDAKKVNETHRIYLYGESEFLKIKKDELSKKLHDELINSISLIANELQDLNLFNKYHSIDYENLSKTGLGDYAKSTFTTDLTNPETLKDLSTNDLIILNLFWINRYAKEAEDFARGLFAISTNKQLSSILAGCFNTKDLDNDSLEKTLLKYHILKQHMENNPELSQKDLFKTFCSTYSQTSYFDYFKNIHTLKNSNNDFKNNFQLFYPFASTIKGLYDNKKDLQNFTIFNLEEIQMFQNVGIIPNQISEDGYSVIINNKLPCLGFDANLTFPVRTHIRLSSLQNFLNSLNLKNTFLRIYEGYRDFTYPGSENTPISAQLVLPFSKESAKYIKKSIKEIFSGKVDPKTADLLLHLNWLKDQTNATPRKYKTVYTTNTRTKEI